MTTRPYYRSTYALVYVAGRELDIRAAEDLIDLPRAARDALRIGVFTPSPAAEWLARHGMHEQMVAYSALDGDPDVYPGKIIENELLAGELDAAILWGPIAGYFAARAAAREGRRRSVAFRAGHPVRVRDGGRSALRRARVARAARRSDGAHRRRNGGALRRIPHSAHRGAGGARLRHERGCGHDQHHLDGHAESDRRNGGRHATARRRGQPRRRARLCRAVRLTEMPADDAGRGMREARRRQDQGRHRRHRRAPAARSCACFRAARIRKSSTSTPRAGDSSSRTRTRASSRSSISQPADVLRTVDVGGEPEGVRLRPDRADRIRHERERPRRDRRRCGQRCGARHHSGRLAPARLDFLRRRLARLRVVGARRQRGRRRRRDERGARNDSAARRLAADGSRAFAGRRAPLRRERPRADGLGHRSRDFERRRDGAGRGSPLGHRAHLRRQVSVHGQWIVERRFGHRHGVFERRHDDSRGRNAVGHCDRPTAAPNAQRKARRARAVTAAGCVRSIT